MSNPLPKTVDPYRLAGTGAELRGRLPLAAMKRLASRLAVAEGEVDVSLAFGIDADHTRYIRGSYSAALQLVCQRCMEAMVFPLRQTVRLGMVTGEAGKADLLPGHYEPLIIEEDSLNLVELVEDEILLALPIVPMHDQKACAISLESLCDAPATAAAETHKPFAKLSGMIKAQNK